MVLDNESMINNANNRGALNKKCELSSDEEHKWFFLTRVYKSDRPVLGASIMDGGNHDVSLFFVFVFCMEMFKMENAPGRTQIDGRIR